MNTIRRVEDCEQEHENSEPAGHSYTPALETEPINRTMNDADDTIGEPPRPLFEITQIPGKGKGLVARQDINEGTTIVCEPPLMTIDQDFFDDRTEDELEEYIAAQLVFMDETQQDQFRSLFRCRGYEDHILYGRYSTNMFGQDGSDGHVYTWVSATICLINHNCIPNCDVAVLDVSDASIIVELRAIQTIRAGEELTLNYLGAVCSHFDRRGYLKENWDFDCQCELCAGDPAPGEFEVQAKQTEETVSGQNKSLFPGDNVERRVNTGFDFHCFIPTSYSLNSLFQSRIGEPIHSAFENSDTVTTISSTQAKSTESSDEMAHGTMSTDGNPVQEHAPTDLEILNEDDEVENEAANEGEEAAVDDDIDWSSESTDEEDYEDYYENDSDEPDENHSFNHNQGSDEEHYSDYSQQSDGSSSFDEKSFSFLPFDYTTANPQDQCPLFQRLPGEIRNHILRYALREYEDKENAYDDKTPYKRPEFAAPRRIDTALLSTCKRIYQEGWYVPWSTAEHVFFLAWQSRKPSRTTTVAQMKKACRRVHAVQGTNETASVSVYAQLCSLEGGQQLESILRIPYLNPSNICVTVRHTDWWSWETDNPLSIASRWTNHCRLPNSTRVFRMQLESTMRRKAQIDDIANQMIQHWTFRREDKTLLTASKGDVSVEQWTGKSTWEDERWVRDESRPGEIDYYVKTVVWKPSLLQEPTETEIQNPRLGISFHPPQIWTDGRVRVADIDRYIPEGADDMDGSAVLMLLRERREQERARNHDGQTDESHS